MKFLATFALILLSSVLAQNAHATEMIVKLRNGSGLGVMSVGAVEHFRGQAKRELADGRMLIMDSDQVDSESLAANPAVEWAEPNYILHIAMGKKPATSTPWGIDKIQAKRVWSEGVTGKDVLVAVIDTGVDVTHPALAGRIFTNTAEIPGNGRDDDGNGYVDDVSGWDFANHDNSPMDDHGHGTHCAGTIAGDVVGVAPGVKILPLKFIAKDGNGTTADAIDAIFYATRMGAKIISNSWGGGDYSQGLYEAIDFARSRGVLFVVAAMNNGGDNDAHPVYPATYPLDNILSVAATDSDDHMASFSNRGWKTVHVAAPGVGVYSLKPKNKYTSMDGTSMAAPHVSGIAALMFEKGISDYATIKRHMIETSDPITGLQVVAHGRVNAWAATR